MDKKKAKTTPRKTRAKKKAASKNNSAKTTEDAKAIAEKIFANLKKPK